MEHPSVEFSLNQLLLIGDRLRAALAARSGLTPVESAALFHLETSGPLTQRSLGDRVGLSTGAVTGLVDRLERHGVCRREPHPTDRRSSYVTLTERGCDILAEARERLTSVGDVVPVARRTDLAGDLASLADSMAAQVDALTSDDFLPTFGVGREDLAAS